jgi:hypothetical protein
MSPRTAKYVEAMIREDFEYNDWLQRVRQEDAHAKQVPTATPRAIVAARADSPINASDSRDARPRLGPVRTIKPGLNSRALRRPHREVESQTPKARLRRWLEKVHPAWDDFQSSRARDAVYGYLEAVFAIVSHYRLRRKTNRLLRHAYKFADRPFNKNVDAFTAIIRCTSERDIDSKTISKYARALRYAARRKEPDIRLMRFMKKMGGVNACAALCRKLRRH